VFAGVCWTYPDDRRDYGEDRFITIGWFKRRRGFSFGPHAARIGASSA
jgi:hypothetical protein